MGVDVGLGVGVGLRKAGVIQASEARASQSVVASPSALDFERCVMILSCMAIENLI
jgi:hypothetical protein